MGPPGLGATSGIRTHDLRVTNAAPYHLGHCCAFGTPTREPPVPGEGPEVPPSPLSPLSPCGAEGGEGREGREGPGGTRRSRTCLRRICNPAPQPLSIRTRAPWARGPTPGGPPPPLGLRGPNPEHSRWPWRARKAHGEKGTPGRPRPPCPLRPKARGPPRGPRTRTKGGRAAGAGRGLRDRGRTDNLRHHKPSL